ncbi:TrmH family RNA methyltransferase [Escherichia coli]
MIAGAKRGSQYQENDPPDRIASPMGPFLLILDGVTHPHNLGACLRSADAAGVHAVIVPKDCSAEPDATAKKAACGAAESVPVIRVTNLACTMRTSEEEEYLDCRYGRRGSYTLSEQDAGRLALVMGAEGEGMSPER